MDKKKLFRSVGKKCYEQVREELTRALRSHELPLDTVVVVKPKTWSDEDEINYSFQFAAGAKKLDNKNVNLNALVAVATLNAAEYLYVNVDSIFGPFADQSDREFVGELLENIIDNVRDDWDDRVQLYDDKGRSTTNVIWFGFSVELE